MAKVVILTIVALILAGAVIMLFTYLVFVVKGYFVADRAALRRARHEAEDATADLDAAIAREKRRRAR